MRLGSEFPNPPRIALILHAHAGSVSAIAGELNLVSGTLAIWPAIFATLLWRAIASWMCALVLRFGLPLFECFFSDHVVPPFRAEVVIPRRYRMRRPVQDGEEVNTPECTSPKDRMESAAALNPEPTQRRFELSRSWALSSKQPCWI